MKLFGVLCAAVILSSVIGLVLWRGRSAAHPAIEASNADELIELREELARARQEIRQANATASAAARMAAKGIETNPQAEEPRDEPQTRPTKPPLPEAEVWKRTADRFFGERKDPDWVPKAEALAFQQIRSGLPSESEIKTMECRSSMCRAEMVHRDLRTFQEYFMTMLRSSDRPWGGNVMGNLLRTREDGHVEVEAYYVRPGMDPTAEILAEAAAE